MTRLAVLTGCVALLAACEQTKKVPLPRLPQVEQATEVWQGGRLRSHQTCSATADTVGALIECMQKFGYEFVPRGTTYPGPECWDLREARGDKRLPPPYCFLRARTTSGEPAPAR